MEYPRSHARQIHKIVQCEGSPGLSQCERGYDLFVTTAVSDCTKLWDARSKNAVQKFDSWVNTRHQCGVDISPCLRYLSIGGEDGNIHLFDTRKTTYELEKITTNCDVITDVAFSGRQPQLYAASLDGHILSFDPSND